MSGYSDLAVSCAGGWSSGEEMEEASYEEALEGEGSSEEEWQDDWNDGEVIYSTWGECGEVGDPTGGVKTGTMDGHDEDDEVEQRGLRRTDGAWHFRESGDKRGIGKWKYIVTDEENKDLE